jgi:hypothetical protein
LREAEQKIAAEKRATEVVAQITEQRRARVAERAFSVAEKMIDHADAVMAEHPTSSARLLATGIAAEQAMGGDASNYNAPAVHFEVIQEYVNEDGTLSEPPPTIETLEQMEQIISEATKVSLTRGRSRLFLSALGHRRANRRSIFEARSSF